MAPDDDRDGDDVATEAAPLPARLSIVSWCEGEVDLTEPFGLGKIRLKDGTPARVQEWLESAGKTHGTAKLLAAYVDRCEDGRLPPSKSGWGAWQKALEAGPLTQKPLKALTDCILAFGRHVGDEARTAPNS